MEVKVCKTCRIPKAKTLFDRRTRFTAKGPVAELDAHCKACKSLKAKARYKKKVLSAGLEAS